MIRLYYSKLALLPEKGNDRYHLHLAVSSAFDGRELNPETNRILWRLEMNRRMLLVQSEEPPNWKGLDQQGLLQRPVEVEQLELRLSSGQRSHFYLDANPVFRSTGKVTPITDKAGQIRWLKRQFEEHGLVAVQCVVAGTEVFRLPKKADSNLVTILCCHFQGILQIQDPEKALDGIRKGIGRAKFAGLGLLKIYSDRA